MTKRRDEAEAELRKDLARFHPGAFPLAVAAPNLSVGVNTLVQAYGIGPIRANTILLNWLEQLPGGEKTQGTQSYGHNLRGAFRLGCNIIVLDAKEDAWAASDRVAPGEASDRCVVVEGSNVPVDAPARLPHDPK